VAWSGALYPVVGWEVAEVGQSCEHPRPVGAHDRAGLDRGGSEVDQVKASGAVRDPEADPAQAVSLPPFHRDHHRGLAAGGTEPARADPADEGLVELDHTVEPVPARADHGPTDLVQPRRRGLVRAEAEDPLQALSGDPVLL